MVWPREVPYSALHRVVAVAGSFGAEFEDAPFFVVLVGEEGEEAGEWVSVGARGICDGWAGGYED